MNTNQLSAHLAAELKNLDLYLNLQQLRYGSSLVIEKEIQEGLSDIQVPFNFLQPIVENAFIHGSAEKGGKRRIKIIISQKRQHITFEIINNGSFISENRLQQVKENLTTNTGHGLSLIYAKLTVLYQNDFLFDIGNTAAGVFVRIAIPSPIMKET